MVRLVHPKTLNLISKTKTAIEVAIRGYKSISYEVRPELHSATITLNRPQVFNAIDENTPLEIEEAVETANQDANIKTIVVTGSGKAFCSGYDLKKYAEAPRGSTLGSQKMPWDPYLDYQFMSKANSCYMSLWRSLKPTVAKINGDCIAGGTDIALACDITFIASQAMIGYPPTRIWGCPTGAMWFYRLGLEKAKRLLFTGDLITGTEAALIGLVGQVVELTDLDKTVDDFLRRLKGVPTNQLFFQKQVVNNAVEMAGLVSTQRLATLFDGMSRHTPEGVEFQEKAHKYGFKNAIKDRDSRK